HFEMMKDGAIVCNTGHYDCEINLKDLETITISKQAIRPNCVQYTLKNGRRIFILGEGRLVNLVAAEGHPSEVMDMSFANQFMAMMFLARNRDNLENRVYDITEDQDQEIAALKLATMNIVIDQLTEEQVRYKTAYSEGT
ncbi:MAG TPA: adenosylhomocysteinase, partial [Candidatus Marinimicrobia bacterium]|nr:adenosylhomocysteinase [Candidatus Neomarinimicrobiota bacterium]